MTDEESRLTPAGQRTAASLERALHDMADEHPLAADPWGIARAAETDGKRLVSVKLRIGLAAALVVVVVGLAGFVARPWTASPAPGSTSPESAHFQGPTYSFDYPADWRSLSAPFGETFVVRVDTVIGTGDWTTGCTATNNGEACTGDVVDVSAGRIVVKIWRRVDGPVQLCMGADAANATLGPNAVQQIENGSVTAWEIRQAGNEFGWINNVFVEVWADGPSQLDAARALAASFRWDSGRASAEPSCGPTLAP